MKTFCIALAASTVAAVLGSVAPAHASQDNPLKGRFENGVGAFYADDTLRGKPIRVRFILSQITATAAHWEQAFSPDGGKTWETNWVTDFRRAP